MKNKKGFTLVELLAVIVILAIILVIAVPQILNTINSARLGAFRSTAKLLLSQAEKQYLVDTTLGGTGAKTYTGATGTGSCSELAKLDDNYANCKIEVTNNDGSAAVSLKLTGDKKFEGYGCIATSATEVEGNNCKDGVTVNFS